MNEHNQIVRLCGICDYKREYNEYQRVFNDCRKCAAIRSSKQYQANREKIIARTKLYEQNKKEKPTRNRKTVNSNRNVKEVLNKKIEDLKNS